MLVYGFRTDSNKFQSVEKLAGRPVDKTCLEAAGLTTPLSTTAMTRKLAPISSVWHVKGWKRTVVAQVIATILMHEGEAVKAMQQCHPEIFSSFCTVHCVINTFSSMEESIKTQVFGEHRIASTLFTKLAS